MEVDIDVKPKKTEASNSLENEENICMESIEPLLSNEDRCIVEEKDHPIFMAITNKNIEVLKSEVKNNSYSVNLTNHLGNTPLHEAIGDGWQEGLSELLKSGASPDILSKKTLKNINESDSDILIESPFHKAVRMENIDNVKLLIKYNPDLKIEDENGATVIHIAAQAKNNELLKLFLERNESKDLLSMNDKYGNNVLHTAVSVRGNKNENQVLECVKYLLAFKLNSSFQNTDGETPLYCAAKSGYSSVIMLLLEYNSDLSVLTYKRRNVLHAACQAGSEETLKILISTGKLASFVTSEDVDGNSPFHLAVKSGSIECCEMLLLHGDHLTNKDSKGETRCSLIINTFASPNEFFQRIFDSHIIVPHDTSRYHPDFYVKYDYSIIAKIGLCDKQISITGDLINSAQERFLGHPLIETFISVKWKKIKYPFYYKFISFFLFLILHSVYLILTFGASPLCWDNLTEKIVKYLHIFLFFVIAVPDVLYLSFNRTKYLKQWETYIKFIAVASCSYVLFSPTIVSCKQKKSSDIQIAAISAFMCWLEFMLLLGRFPIKHFPSLGIYIMMLVHVAKSTIKFIIAFLSLLIGFSLSFYIIFADVQEFNTFPRSFARTLMMVVIGFENWAKQKSDNEPSINITDMDNQEFNDSNSDLLTEIMQNVFLLMYAILVSILMANLLTGLAINDIDELNRQGNISKLSKQGTYIDSYENILENLIKLNCLPKYFKRRLKEHAKSFIIHNNEFNPNQKKMRNKNQKKTIQNAINLKCDEQEEDINEDFRKMFSKFNIRYKKDQQLIKEELSKLRKFQIELYELHSSVESKVK